MVGRLKDKLKQIFKEAFKTLKGKDSLERDKKLGILRGGSCGALLSNGDCLQGSTKCSRLDQMRLLGIEKETSEEDQVAFSAGFGHELYIDKHLKESGLEYKREESYTIEKDGLTWSGRPDFEVKIDGEWIGIEAKSLISAFSVAKQVQADVPFMRHMIQSAAYMTFLDRNTWLICIGHYFYAQAGSERLNPSIRWYEMAYNEEEDSFIIDGKQLPFGKAHIITYYKQLGKWNTQEKLGPRPKELEIGGIKPYNRCNYCPMNSDCNAYDNDQMDFKIWKKRLINPNKEVKKDESETKTKRSPRKNSNAT